MPSAAETATQALHRLTSYEPGREWTDPPDDPRIVRDLEPNDLDRLPWFFKRYEGSKPTVDLPRELPTTTASAVAVLAGTAEVRPSPMGVAQLGRLLHLSAGVVRTTERPYATWLFRAAGSAGGRFPLEVYLCAPEDVDGLPAGVHWYHPLEHALVRVGPPPLGEAPAIVVTGVPWRTAWRYRERGFRHVYWDAGTMLAQLLAAAESAGAAANLFSRFPDRAVAELVGADGVHEWPVAVVALGDGDPAIEASGAADTGAVDAAPRELPLVTAAQRAGDTDALDGPWERGARVDTVGHGRSSRVGRPIEEVVLARGSMRRMDAAGHVSRAVLEISMGVAMRGIDLPHFVAVHAVEELQPGLYRWPDLSSSVRRGDLRAELYRVALDQRLARDAAFVSVAAATVPSLDDRAYREAQLAAGLVEGRLHLAAHALGAAASGMTFLDSEIPALLGQPLDGLLLTCVGVPGYVASPGGPPGAPRAVRQPSARD